MKKKSPHCRFCNTIKPEAKLSATMQIKVKGVVQEVKRFQVACKCGATGKFANSKDLAMTSWSEPWQQKHK